MNICYQKKENVSKLETKCAYFGQRIFNKNIQGNWMLLVCIKAVTYTYIGDQKKLTERGDLL